MKETILHLGALVRKDRRTSELAAAEDAYNKSGEMTRLVDEYNEKQSELAEAYAADERDDELISAIEKRINEIYDAVTNNDLYADYLRAKADYDELYSAITAELEFAITGRAPCSHDCSSCGGCG
jgi:anti-sigma-K factor RskA